MDKIEDLTIREGAAVKRALALSADLEVGGLYTLSCIQLFYSA
jgi:hypothetical protein